MESVIQWVQVAPLALSIIVVLFLPGLLVASILFPKTAIVLRVAQAPAWTVGIVASWTILSGLFPFRWGLVPFIGYTFVVSVIARFASKTRWVNVVASTMPEQEKPRPKSLIRIVATLAVWLIVLIPVFLNSSPFDAIQGGDVSYHYNQLWLMEQTGNASPLNANATMAGLSDKGWYYPNTWHALLSLVTAGKSQGYIAANTMLLVTPLVWLIGVGTWSVAVGGNKNLYEWSFLGSVLAPIALVRLQFSTTLWPFVLGVVVLPGMMAVWYYGIRKIRRIKSPRKIAKSLLILGVVTALPLVGLVGIHPSTILPPTFAFFIYLIFELVRIGIKLYQENNVKSATRYVVSAVFLLYLMIFVVDGPTPARRVLFHRFPEVGWDQVPQKVFASFSLFMPRGGIVTVGFYTFVFLIVIASLFVAFKKKRWILLSGWLSQWILIIASFFPIKGISRITSLYYNHPDRAKTAIAIFVVPLIALLAQTLWEWISARNTRLSEGKRWGAVLATTILAYAWISPGMIAEVKRSFYPDKDDVRYLADEPEIEMIKRADEKLPDGAVVLGDPAAGTTLLQTLSNVSVVWPYPNQPLDREDQILLNQFNSISYNADVCDVLDNYGIKYFYADTPRYYNGGYTDRLRPGLYYVPLHAGFELVDSGGTAAIYEITICDTPERPTYYPSLRTATTCTNEGNTIACLE